MNYGQAHRPDSPLMNATFATRWNQGAIDEAYQRWRQDPASVDDLWRAFFEGFELAERTPAPLDASAQLAIFRLVHAYRDRGHMIAHVDPLSETRPSHPSLELSQFGLSDADLNRTFDAIPFLGLQRGTLRELLDALRETYCRTIGVEYLHIQDPTIRQWLQERMEPRRNRPNLPLRQKMRILMVLHYAELFEKFLHTRYQGQKRFSLEGAETTIPVLDAMIEKSAEMGAQEVILGMAHRGRLNVLTNILRKPYQDVFSEFEDIFDVELSDGDGDVKYHLGFSSDFETAKGHKIHLSLSPNPSHLEAVNPVVEGRTRAKQELFGDKERTRGIPLLIHGDAAFAGQGSIAETLNLCNLSGYTTGGTLHVVINNQIGFTTSPADARSTQYCTDVAKMIQAPIFHVNAEDPEAAIFVAEMAAEFRQRFHRDVVLDLVCFRRHGHNEGDNPAFTQPVLYSKIKNHPSQLQIYEEHLVLHGDLTAEAAEAIDAKFQEKLKKAQEEVKREPPKRRGMRGFSGRWATLKPRYSFAPAATAVPYELVREITDRIVQMPDSFALHPTIARIFETRQTLVTERKPIDWSFAETLAFGTLLAEGSPVRLSGQDSRRGTFSQRHAVVFDGRTNAPYIPLNHIRADQAKLQVYDSMLSEFAVLGFEFGYALDDPKTLVLWEAQFGDFANGAQVIIDQFLVCSESKWQRACGLVLLLPHGYEGQGPEHSSARLERYLQLSAEDNIQVCNLTTPAQYFHALRRQMKRDFRKPLILMTPKSLLRHKEAVSPISDFTNGQFREVLDDPTAEPDRVRRVVLCSGKVYYDLQQHRTEKDRGDVAVVRLEQLYPLSEDALKQTLGRYRRAKERVWAQEEPWNMGGWAFIEPRLRALGYDVQFVGRDASASPATGSHKVHEQEQHELVAIALSGPVPHQVRAMPSPALSRSRGDTVETDGKRPAMSPRS
jgi:2-oxoglutarate dehydrogenase E1 component